MQSPPYIPSRLIEITGAEANPFLRIIEVASHPCDGEYITLSHCWGTAEFMTLREDRIDSMKEGIVWSNLPKTFQDAVIVAMWLKIKYLWIDSLCIVQDSREDWEREARSMKHVYKNSLLTIAATKAVDATGGLFVDRNPDIVRVPRVRAQLSQELEGDYLLVDDNLWSDEINESPLMKRAWVCQERLLSPRVLHFGRSQVFWECQHLSACETFPEILPPERPTTTSTRDKRLLLFKDRSSHLELWRSVVNLYSSGNLTRISDKCIAFAGIVEEFQDFAEGRYLAGFWRQNLEQQLLWIAVHPASRPQSYLAPSWSWLAIDGKVLPARIYNMDKVLVNIFDIGVTYYSDNTFGPIKHGCIKARGILGLAVWERKSPTRTELRLIHGRDPSQRPYQCIISMDERVGGVSHDAVYLPIVDRSHHHVLQGLLLAPTGKAKNEYQRIGMFSITGQEDYRLMTKTKTKRGVWRSLPRRTFTLV